MQNHYETTIFGGILAAIAEGLGGPSPKAWPGVAAEPREASPVPAPSRPGLLGRIGERLWRQQLRSVQEPATRSNELFASLDRWLWKQQIRDNEAWLAQSHDIYDLEARIRHLERNRDGRLF